MTAPTNTNDNTKRCPFQMWLRCHPSNDKITIRFNPKDHQRRVRNLKANGIKCCCLECNQSSKDIVPCCE